MDGGETAIIKIYDDRNDELVAELRSDPDISSYNAVLPAGVKPRVEIEKDSVYAPPVVIRKNRWEREAEHKG